MRRMTFLGVHQEGNKTRSVVLRTRGRSGYRLLSFGSKDPSAFPGIAWGTALSTGSISIKVASVSGEADSWRERELQNIEVRREPQGSGLSLKVITVAAQGKEVKGRGRLWQGVDDPTRIDAEPLALWAVRRAWAKLPEGPFFVLHALEGRWIILFVQKGLLLFADHFPCSEKDSPSEETAKLSNQVRRIARVMGCSEADPDLHIELSGEDTDRLRGVEEGLTLDGWYVMSPLPPSRRFRRQFKDGGRLPVSHLIALGIALREIEAAKGLPYLNFSAKAAVKQKVPWYVSPRLTTALVVGCALVWVVTTERSVRNLEAQANQLTSKIQHYVKTLGASSRPGSRDLEKKMSTRLASYQSEMKRLGAARYPSVTSVEILAALSEVFSKAPSFELKEILLDGENILLRGSLDTLERVTLFQESMKKIPLIRSVDLLSAQSQKNRVEARFRVLGPPWYGEQSKR